MSSDRDEAARVRERVRDAVVRVRGRAAVILIDGPSGAGKSSLADALVAGWPAPGQPRLVRMDDLYPGWSGLDEASAMIGRELLAPLGAGRSGRWQRWDWQAAVPAEWHPVDGAEPVIVEGCGTLSVENARLADLSIWLDADDAVRKQRALDRDGDTFAAHWNAWQADFDRYVRREHPRQNADLVLDVTGWPLGAAAASRTVSARRGNVEA